MKNDLLHSVTDQVAYIVINRPEKLNAFDSSLTKELFTLLCDIDENPDIRVVIIRGAGGKAFVAGADIAELHRMRDVREFQRYFDSNVRLYAKIRNLSQPVVAMVDGYAFGGGCGLVLACDLVFATTNSKFGTQEINMGFVGNGAALVALAGRQKAAELTMLGGTISAEEAHRIMLVNKVVPQEQLEDTVNGICATLKKKSPHALKMSKKVINMALEGGYNAACCYESDVAAVCFETEECKGAIAAFVNKT